MNRIPELDGLRGIAILLVIGCHYQLFAAQLWTLPRFGWVGVDIFFVLSGFLITSVLLKLKGQDKAFRTFYARRARRILPPYLLFLLLLFGASWILGETTLFRPSSIIGKLLFLQAFGSLPATMRSLAHGVPQFAHLPPILPGISGELHHSASVLWSLSIEEYFYLLWAPAVIWLSRKRLAILIGAICVSTMALRWFGFIGIETYVSGYHRFDALIYGAIVALVITSAPRRWFAVAAASAALLLAGTLIPLWPIIGLEIRDSRVFDAFGLAAISVLCGGLLGGTVLSSGSRWLAALRFAPLTFIGQISYMLYLMHAFVYLIVMRFLPLSWGSTFLALGLAIGLCWLSWRYIETPILAVRAPQGSELSAQLARDSVPRARHEGMTTRHTTPAG